MSQHLAAAQAYAAAADLAGMEQELVQARARMETAGYGSRRLRESMEAAESVRDRINLAIAQFAAFTSHMNEMRNHLYGATDNSGNLARKSALAALSLYHVLETEAWLGQPEVQQLDSVRQGRLEEMCA